MDRHGEQLHVRVGGVEGAVTGADLEDALSECWRGGTSSVCDVAVDESMVTSLLRAYGQPQPIWPPVLCRWCDTEATAPIVDGVAYCHAHLQAIDTRDEETP